VDCASPTSSAAHGTGQSALLEAPEGPHGGVALLKRFAQYLEEGFDFLSQVDTLTDSRQGAEIPTTAVWLSVFGGFALRQRSLNALEQELKLPHRWEAWVGSRKPSADTIAYAFCRLDLGPLRALTRSVAQRLKRRKALRSSTAHWVAAVDGHELFSSRKRCCAECLVREIETRHGKVVEYYHRVVVCQLVGVLPPMVLDIEPIRPGEGETAAAHRLLQRLLATCPRMADVFTFDALYLEAPLVRWLRARGKHVVIVLKEDRLILTQDVEGLLPLIEPVTIQAGSTAAKLWDLEHLTSWPALGGSVRVICAEEETPRRERVAHEWIQRTERHTWRWVTTLPASEVSAATIRCYGHWRWDLENRGFNEWVTHWGFDHCFAHAPKAILAFLFTLVLAFALTMVFFMRSLKPALRAGRTRLWLALRFFEGFISCAGAPVWARAP